MSFNLKPLCLALAVAGCLGSQAVSAQTFTDVTAAAGISGGAGSWAGAWGDYDRDGDLDLYSIGHLQPATGGKNQLWRNNGDGTFTDVTAAAIVSDKIDTHGAAWADFDRDGDLDLILINESITDKPQLFNEFWRNNGDGTFTEIGAAAGILGMDHITRGVATADYDRDGLLDIFAVAQDLHRFPNTPPSYSPDNLLWHNDGGLVFSEVAVAAGVAMPTDGGKRTAAFADFDSDGWPDLMVLPTCTLFRNNQNGTFTDVTDSAGIVRSEQCQGAGWADYDNDGDQDVFISRGFDLAEPSLLYRNNNDGTFTDVTATAGIVHNELSRSVTWGDYDNDGDVDLYVVNFKNVKTPNRLYRNNNDGTFTDVTVATGTGAQVAGGGAHGGWADYNNDGNLDLFITNGESTNTGPYVLLKNSGGANHWSKLNLVGIASNPDAIGTKVKMETATLTRYAFHSGNAAWMSQSAMPVHFGTAADKSITRFTLTWPSGTVQKLENIGADQTITVEEGVAHFAGTPTTAGDGYYISREGTRWKLLWKGKTGPSRFSGRISTNGTFSNVVTNSFESVDKLTTTSNSLTISASESGASPDSIEFDASGTQVTFNLKQDGTAQPAKVFIGKHSVRPGTLPVTFRP